MKNKWILVVAIGQITFGLLAIASFIILLINKENILRWIPTFLLAIAFVVLGIIGIKDYIKDDIKTEN